MTDRPFIEGVSPEDLENFEENGYSAEDSIDLAQSLLVMAIPCLEKIYTNFSGAERKAVKFAVLEMAKYIRIDYFNFERSTSPFQSETIGAYTYSKVASSVKNNTSTGVPAFDRAVSMFSGLCSLDGEGVALYSSEQVVKPGFNSYIRLRENGPDKHTFPRWPFVDRMQP